MMGMRQIRVGEGGDTLGILERLERFDRYGGKGVGDKWGQ